MKPNLLFTFIIVSFLTYSCTSQEKTKTQIAWDTWGVPHITADTVEELFYAQGWAQMHNHANLILKLYGGARGKGAEYWGQEQFGNDRLVHTLGFDQLADDWEKNQDPELKIIYTSFINGMNAYATLHPEAIDEKNKVVLPLTTKDVNMHSMYVIFTRFIAGNDLGHIQQWPDMGSNAYAIAPSRSASGNAMLVQNPHLPWWQEFLFFESHLNLKGKNMYGATLVGFPGIAIGFNKNLGWTHTNNTIDNADTYELNLKGKGYLLDGKQKAFETSSKTIKIKLKDGKMIDEEIPILKTVHGPVVNKTENKVLALRMVGLDKPNMLLQWWRMINSNTFNEFESALKMAQIPFWNVMYADKTGDIFYLFNGLVPKRTENAWAYWDRIIPGGKSADIWSEVHQYADLPKVKNPVNGWLQNANDPPWTSTIPMSLNPNDFPGYMSPQSMSFRPQRSARMLIEDESITFDELVDYKLSTHLEFADRILDDLFIAIDASDSELAKRAKIVLQNWDRTADADSKGMLLFYSWAQKFNVWNDTNYKEKWNIDKPNTTPDGIADPDRAVQLLEKTVRELETKFGSLDIAWGEYYRINYNGKNLPANGADGSMGIFRVAWPGGRNDDHMFVGGGDSWVGVIEFGDTVKAKVLLSYGNATQKDSPHYGDQLELFSKKELRDAWFTKAEVKSNTKRIEVMTDNGFREKK
ncbi:acylase [Aquimarina sp. BL5]|uniref:acylase n=1 Tax=Aquimarina sp. BL5 TaxID=1714860 RepID=UPI000E49CF86|nr:acylase [Aquimarina sp. BL5]AXT50582.1 acylase [Aquimarina sp. BL5]RKN02911.1 acylase [Aquimarina sp. BL5]